MYSEEETLKVELPYEGIPPAPFTAFINQNQKTIKQLIIEQKDYYCYQRCRSVSSVVTIPDTITNLREVERITISALVETLPKSLCNLKKLELLDLTGCYNILSIPPEILAMSNLTIKIGTVISPASEVVVIKIPRRGISRDIFRVVSSGNKRKISQLIIHQESQEYDHSLVDAREEVVTSRS